MPSSTRNERRLLMGGLVSGPLFSLVVAIQVVTRDGFDLTEHPLSLLSLGDRGWIQIANFIVTGLLLIAFAAGTRRTLLPGRGRRWGPLLLGGFGTGLVIAGMFTADPSQGFPAGAPPGKPENLSGHAILHGLGFGVAMLCVTSACFVFARRFAANGQRRFAIYSVLTAVVAAGLAGWPGQDGASIRYALASAVVFTWATRLSLQLAPERTATVHDVEPALAMS